MYAVFIWPIFLFLAFTLITKETHGKFCSYLVCMRDHPRCFCLFNTLFSSESKYAANVVHFLSNIPQLFLYISYFNAIAQKLLVYL